MSKKKTLIFWCFQSHLIKDKFYYDDFVIENVKEFKYLGVSFKRTGSFCKTKKTLFEQAQKAMYCIIRKSREFKLSVECQFGLFDKVVVPVLLYGSEVWGYERFEIIERLHLKYLKYIFYLKRLHHPTWCMVKRVVSHFLFRLIVE